MPAILKAVRCPTCGDLVEVLPLTGVLTMHGARGKICLGSATGVESGGAGRAPAKPRAAGPQYDQEEETVTCPGCKRSVRAFLGKLVEHWISEYGGAYCEQGGKVREGYRRRPDPDLDQVRKPRP